MASNIRPVLQSFAKKKKIRTKQVNLGIFTFLQQVVLYPWSDNQVLDR